MAIGNRGEVKRIMLKLSGEALGGESKFGISYEFIETIIGDIRPLVKTGIEIGIVIGGGNFFRGSRLKDTRFSRLTGDYLGMIATIFNALAMADVFNQRGIFTQVMSAIPVGTLIEPYNRMKADEYLSKGKVVIFAGGTGNPFATTDSALCLRGIELDADLLLKATNVDGIYSDDPKKVDNSQLYSRITYDEALTKGLNVMDTAAFSLGRDHRKKLVVFNINKKGALLDVVAGKSEGTIVENE